MNISAPKISVIIPVYNTARWLPACVESLRSQTLTDWQGILVDDGSTDDSGTLCDTLAGQDPRLQVIHRPNGGLAAARNTGLAAATGEAVGFLDSDDTLEPDYLQNLWNVFENSDLAVAAIETISIDGTVTRLENAVFDTDTAGWLRAIIYSQQASLLAMSSCNKLYRRKLIIENNLRQPEHLRRGEDAVFNPQYLLYTQRVTTNNAAVYRYQRRDGSLMNAHVDLVSAAQAKMVQGLTDAAQQHGLLSDPDFYQHLCRYKLDAFFFAAYQITGSALGKKKTAALLGDLARRRLVTPGEVLKARDQSLPWLLLAACITCRSGALLLGWMLLAARVFHL